MPGKTAKDPLQPLRALAGWMRDIGATRARLPDGTELELGPKPRDPNAQPPPKLSPLELEQARQEHVNRVMFGATSVRPVFRRPPPTDEAG